MESPTLHVQCGNGHWAHGYPGDHANPDAVLRCPPGEGCCAEDHDHAGNGCRPVTITALEGSVESLQPSTRGSI